MLTKYHSSMLYYVHFVYLIKKINFTLRAEIQPMKRLFTYGRNNLICSYKIFSIVAFSVEGAKSKMGNGMGGFNFNWSLQLEIRDFPHPTTDPVVLTDFLQTFNIYIVIEKFTINRLIFTLTTYTLYLEPT